MGRIHGRITAEDIRAAGLRRWDGRERITTDWISLYHDRELCFPDGDCLVYLREPGQSSRGPSFRIHISQLLLKGFKDLVARTTPRPLLHPANTCSVPDCEGCDRSGLRELYLPAPSYGDLDSIIDYHLTTRNFFAWLYKLPLVGRALGISEIDLKQRVDGYRPGEDVRNELEITAFLEFHRYLDFRECVDHALAALHFAECLELEDLWIDAFAHCVGMGHKGMRSSLEFPAISKTSKTMIANSRLEMDIRQDRVSRSVMNFFESDLSGSFLGLHQAAREHFDRFRSFLHAFYIEQYGFWPPENFDDESVKRALYATMYSDFRNLYHHLVDIESTPSMAPSIAASGGVCTLQNTQAFDQRYGYEALPHSAPMLPTVIIPPTAAFKSRRSTLSLNPIKKSKLHRDAKMEAEMQALIDSSNRDWNIMSSLIVRRYSEFEQKSVLDDFEHVSVVDGRKVRWILIYAVLQTLVSVMQAPQQVRNTEGLSYSLCCHTPKVMPWRLHVVQSRTTSTTSRDEDRQSEKAELEPDNNYSHTNSSSSSIGKERRNSLLVTNTSRSGSKTPPTIRPASLRRLLSRRSTNGTIKTASSSKQPAFCEIFVQGYGNGLNEVKIESKTAVAHDAASHSDDASATAAAATAAPTSSQVEMDDRSSTPTSGGVSRESSNASGYSSRSTATDTSGTMPDMEHLSVVDSGETLGKNGEGEVRYEKNEVGQIHFNTETWDRILEAS